MLRWRSVAIVVIASLLIVPAAVRAAQAIDPGSHAPAPSSFSKSIDVPDVVVIAPDLACTPVDVDALRHPIARSVVVFDDRVPLSPDLIDVDLLRGPPILPIV